MEKYLNYKKTTLDSSIGEHGAIIVDGKLTLALAQDAYIDGTDGNAYYIASAHNILDEDETYEIKWDLRDDYMDDYLKTYPESDNGDNPSYDSFLSEIFNGDESSMCDWDNPSSIRRT